MGFFKKIGRRFKKTFRKVRKARVGRFFKKQARKSYRLIRPVHKVVAKVADSFTGGAGTKASNFLDSKLAPVKPNVIKPINVSKMGTQLNNVDTDVNKSQNKTLLFVGLSIGLLLILKKFKR